MTTVPELGKAIHSVVVPPGVSLDDIEKHFGPNFKNHFKTDARPLVGRMNEFVQLSVDHFTAESLDVEPLGDTGAYCIVGELANLESLTPAEKSEFLEIASKGQGTAPTPDGANFGEQLNEAMSKLAPKLVAAMSSANIEEAQQALSDFIVWYLQTFEAINQPAGKSEQTVQSELGLIRERIGELRGELRFMAAKGEQTPTSERDDVWSDMFKS